MTDIQLSIVVPSRTEKFLYQTTKDILSNATSNIELFVMLDGYSLPKEEIVEDNRITYITLPPIKHTQKRHAINLAMSKARGKYVMCFDAHCLVAKGFDQQLIKDHQPNWVQIPRRHRLDPVNWCLQTQSDDRPPIDYEYIMFDKLLKTRAIHGFKWDLRTRQRWNIPIDETMEIQGSTWFMEKAWFEKMGFMQVEGYTGFGQEGEEIVLTTYLNGGKVMTNKSNGLYYAHLHKGATYGRMYWMSRDENRKSWAYSYNKWVLENKDFFISHIERFMPVPGWPVNWKDIINKLQ